MTGADPGWLIYRDGPHYIWVPKGLRIPGWVKLRPCKECDQAHYYRVKYRLVGEWKGKFTEETGPFLNKIMKGGAGK